MASHFHLEEASRIPDDRGMRTAFINLFWETVKWNLLLPTKELGLLEAQRRRRLEAAEPFEDFGRRREIRVLTKDKNEFDGIAADVTEFVDSNVTDISARRTG